MKHWTVGVVMTLLLGAFAVTPAALAQPADCGDAVDNDGDGLTDHPDDPGCLDAQDDNEVDPPPQCSDGVDNDNDGKIDFPEDPSCESAEENAEERPMCDPTLYSGYASTSSCLASNVTIGYEAGIDTFKGVVGHARAECKRAREVILFKVRPGKNRAVGSTLSNRRGRWSIETLGRIRGRFYAVAPGQEAFAHGGDLRLYCSGDRSVTIRGD